MDVLTVGIYLLVAYIVYRLVDYVLYLPKISKRPESLYILVTGCDTGFGNALAKRLDGMGCHVFAGCLTEAGETNLRKSCSSRLKAINMDVSKRESVQKAFQFVTSNLPSGAGLWGVVNNAGIFGRDGPEDWLTLDDHRSVTDVNLFGVIDVTKTFLPLIKKTKGRIVNTASMAGRIAVIAAPYTVSKYGVEAFSDCLRREMWKFGVSVSLIEPGFFKTDIIKMDEARFRKARQHFDGLPQETKDEYGNQYVEDMIDDMRERGSSFLNEDITPVIDADVHALTGAFPRARYAVGKDARIWMFLQRLPEWIGDRFLRRMFNAKAFPAALKS